MQSIEVGALLALAVSNLVLATAYAMVLLLAVDVIHALAVPGLGVKADAIPGRAVLVRLGFSTFGRYTGQCSELCGSLHSFMPLSWLAAVALRADRLIVVGLTHSYCMT